jgi:hypothetical protein
MVLKSPESMVCVVGWVPGAAVVRKRELNGVIRILAPRTRSEMAARSSGRNTNLHVFAPGDDIHLLNKARGYEPGRLLPLPSTYGSSTASKWVILAGMGDAEGSSLRTMINDQ